MEIDAESTDQYEDPQELRRMRQKRPTSVRLEKLETKHDDLAKEVAQTKALVAVVDAKTDGQTKLIERIEKTVDRIANRDDVKFESNLTINEAQKLDTIDAKKARRWLIVKVAAAVLGGGTLLELVHWVAGKL